MTARSRRSRRLVTAVFGLVGVFTGSLARAVTPEPGPALIPPPYPPPLLLARPVKPPDLSTWYAWLEGSVMVGETWSYRSGRSAADVGGSLRLVFKLPTTLSLAASYSVSSWSYPAESDIGYGVLRSDFGLTLRTSVFTPARRNGSRIGALYLSLPVGLSTLDVLHSPPRRAFAETVESQWGWYAGAGAGFFVRIPRTFVGFFAEVDCVVHRSALVSTKQPNEGGPPVIERMKVLDQQIMFMLGAALALARS
jgi:hypothetical protein